MITPERGALLAAMHYRYGLRYEIGLNSKAGLDYMAAQVQAAYANLPLSSIYSFDLCNEPDAYDIASSNPSWLVSTFPTVFRNNSVWLKQYMKPFVADLPVSGPSYALSVFAADKMAAFVPVQARTQGLRVGNSQRLTRSSCCRRQQNHSKWRRPIITQSTENWSCPQQCLLTRSVHRTK
jgi:hypothetical protein